MTITQTVEIPADRRITIEVPREVPTGQADVEYKIIPFVNKNTKPKTTEEEVKKIRITKSMIDEMLQDETVLSLTGILKTEMSLDEIREERLAKYLK